MAKPVLRPNLAYFPKHIALVRVLDRASLRREYGEFVNAPRPFCCDAAKQALLNVRETLSITQ
jgi:hypothetical protein